LTALVRTQADGLAAETTISTTAATNAGARAPAPATTFDEPQGRPEVLQSEVAKLPGLSEPRQRRLGVEI
jgi:hypothetical protein